MNFPTNVLLVVQLMTSLCEITLSEELPLTCPDTAQRQLKDISEVYDCTVSFVPEENVLKCTAIYPDGGEFEGEIEFEFTFKMLKKVPGGTAMCLGLQEYSLQYRYTVHMWERLWYRFDFNSSLTVGVLTPDNNNAKTNRTGTISLLIDILNLPIFGKINEDSLDIWDFSSPLFRPLLDWFRGFSLRNGNILPLTNLTWLEGLHNTSIHILHVEFKWFKNMTKSICLRDMPFLLEIHFRGISVEEFTEGSFRGMPKMEALTIVGSKLSGIPPMLDRMPKLKKLEIVDGSHEFIFITRTKTLSTLQNLEVLRLSDNEIEYISGNLPPLSKLRILNLDKCRLTAINEDDLFGFPMLEELYLSGNAFTHIDENTFRQLESLKILDLSSNQLKNWPALYNFSFTRLDLSGNLLMDVHNLGKSSTTVQVLNISDNRISYWEDRYVFSLQKSLSPHDEQRYQLRTNVFTSGSAKTKHFSNILGLSTTQRAHLSIRLHSGSHRKLLNHIPENNSLLNNLYGQTELAKSDSDEKITVKNFENTTEYSSPMKSDFWVKKLIISSNMISDLSQTMIQSLEGIHEVDLGGNLFKCVDCRMIPFQKWLNTTSTNVSNLGTSDPLVCYDPPNLRGSPLNLVQYNEEPCLEKIRTTSLLTLIGVPLGVVSAVAVAAAGGIFKYRSAICYMLHLYKIRRRAMAFSQSVFNKYAFDAFICYSSNDRRFVLTRLAPLLEKGQEQYCVCLHERDFPLGSHIVTNIVGSIQHSRKTIVVLSEHFINSKWCQWELEMANHKMFNEDEHFLILIQFGTLDRNTLPRHLQFLLDTRTYLEWPSAGQDDEEEVKRLKRALGPSIFQTTNERAPLLTEVMEDY